MPKDNHNDGESSSNTKDNKHASDKGLWRIVGIMVLGFIILLAVSYYHPDMTERTKFAIGTVLAFFTLMAIVFQAYIYSRQWEAMRDSLEENRKIVRIARSQVRQVYKQVDLMRDSLEIARQDMVYAQRAYLAICEVRIDSFDQVRLFFRLKFKNFGNTPAYDAKVFAKAGIRKDPPTPLDDVLSADSMLSADWYQLGIIPPGEDAEAISNSITKTEEDWADQHRTDRTIEGVDFYCWGVIQYRDIFETARETSFCLIESLQGPARVQQHETGNKAT
ncbi:MAG: hypothetical protein AABN34_16500 [Acidobacteriota bacterium]